MAREAYFEATNTAVAGTTSAWMAFHQAPKEYGGDAALLVLMKWKSGCRRSYPEKFSALRHYGEWQGQMTLPCEKDALVHISM